MAHLHLPLQKEVRSASVFIPSPQQEAIFDWIENGQGSAIVQAVAGSGKTTTLIEALRLMQGGVFLGAYNKKIVTDIQEKLATRGIMSRNIRISTMHSAGFSAWNYHTKKSSSVNQYKVSEICRRVLVNPLDREYESFITEMVSLAKQNVMGINGSIDDESEWTDIMDYYGVDDKIPLGGTARQGLEMCHYVLNQSIAMNNAEIDMDDMLYAPLLHGANFYKQDWVLLDEAQDTNFARRLIAERMLRPGGRLVAVGDPHQAIYGFTGADADALDLIREKFNCIDLPLTLTYRCPKSVVREAREIVNHIEAHESAQEGLVTKIHLDTLKTMRPFSTDAILCRYTAPLINLAMHFIRNRVPCRVEGRDIGRGLIAMVKKYRVDTITEALKKLDDMLEKKTTEAAGNQRKRRKLEQLRDRIMTIEALSKHLLESGDDRVGALVQSIENLFSDDIKGMLTLSTVHKSKGREWDRVFILGREKYMPSQYAKMPWEITQEYNLIYVAVTRAMRELVYVDGSAEKLEREEDEIQEMEFSSPEREAELKRDYDKVFVTAEERGRTLRDLFVAGRTENGSLKEAVIRDLVESGIEKEER